MFYQEENKTRNNSDKFLNTKAFPNAKLKRKNTNISEIDFLNDASYDAIIKGDLSIKEKQKLLKKKQQYK